MEEITIRKAKENLIIPKEWHSVVPDTCEYCGADNVTTTNLTIQKCSNSHCKAKIIGRAVNMLSNLNVQGVSVGYCKKFFNNTEYKTHLGILLAKKEEYYSTGHYSTSDALMDSLINILNTTYTFNNIVSLLSFPKLSLTATKIFYGVPSYDIFLAGLKGSNLSIREYLMSFDGISYTKAVELENILEEFKEELLLVSQIFKTKANSRNVLTICMTGPPSTGETKKEFLLRVNKMVDGFIDIEEATATSAKFVLSEYANTYITRQDGSYILDAFGQKIVTRGTAKHNIGLERNLTENRKVLISYEEFIDLIRINKIKIRGEQENNDE